MIHLSLERSLTALGWEKQLRTVHMSMCLDGVVLEKAGTILSRTPISRLNEPRSLRTADNVALVFGKCSRICDLLGLPSADH